MACCTGVKPRKSLKESNWATRIETRIKQFREIKLGLDTIGQLCEKFETFSTQLPNGLEVCYESQFRELIGSLGSFYFGQRIFNVVLNLSIENEKNERQKHFQHKVQSDAAVRIWTGEKTQSPAYKPRKYIVVEDYIVYMDMIYHGDQIEKDRISFMMIDEVGQGKITFAFYENFLLQFFHMYGELLQTAVISDNECQQMAFEVFQLIALVDLPPREQASGSQKKRKTGDAE